MKGRSAHSFLNMISLLNSIGRGLRSDRMRATFELKVHLASDDETGRWYVAESDIPGLWLEADTPSELMAKIQEAAPEMLELNKEEVLRNCLEKAAKKHTRKADCSQARIMPVFDSPLSLAYA
jgi:predicted RNase H-like HicB family nuclease